MYLPLSIYFNVYYFDYCLSSQLVCKYENSVTQILFSSLLYPQYLKECQKQRRYNVELSATKRDPKTLALTYLEYLCSHK